MVSRTRSLVITVLVALFSAYCLDSAALAQQGAAGLIVYSQSSSSGGEQLRLIHPDGAGDQPLDTGLVDAEFPTWSRDGQSLAAMGALKDEGDQTQFNVFVFDPQGNNLEQVTDLNVSGFTFNTLFKAFSPDGQRLAVSALGEATKDDPNQGTVTTPAAVVLVARLDQPNQPVVLGAASDTGGAPLGLGIDWSPNSDQIVVPSVTLEDSSGYSLPVTALFTVPPEANALANGGGHQVTFPQRTLDQQVDDVMPAFSPDGKRVAFVRRQYLILEDRFTCSIRVANLDGSQEQQVMSFGLGDVVNRVSWSGDGTALVFDWGPWNSRTGMSNENKTGLWTIRVDGSELNQLKAPPAISPSWSWSK
jgi:Tol biopolymer transport system component